jgi:hypothetical protein
LTLTECKGPSRSGNGVTDHFKTSQSGSNQNRPLQGALVISGFLINAIGFPTAKDETGFCVCHGLPQSGESLSENPSEESRHRPTKPLNGFPQFFHLSFVILLVLCQNPKRTIPLIGLDLEGVASENKPGPNI